MESRRFTILDGLRGVAALSVVLCHYYVLTVVQSPEGVEKGWQPGRFLLGIFYDYGFRAVELFWVISGFIFTYVYCFGRPATSREFAANRFARLYPLHFVTLIVTAVLQFFIFRAFGQYVINSQNDLYHFTLQLFMASAWGLQKGGSYNDVVWSISVEIVVYGLFWVLRDWVMRWRSLGALIIAMGCGLIVLLGPPTFIFACGFFFFFGSALAFARVDLQARRHGVAALIVVLAILGGLNLVSGHPFLLPSLGLSCSAGALVLLAVETEAVAGTCLRGLAQWLGDCSYGIYLWHFPLQLTLILVLSPFADMVTLAAQGWFLAVYLTSLLLLARTSYLLIERPARARLRGLAGKPALPEHVAIAE